MNQAQKVVVHFRGGKVLKGFTRDFSPSRPTFHIDPMDGGRQVDVPHRRLKAVFFVRTFAGNRLRTDLRGFLRGPIENSQGIKLAVRFGDGEWICGYSVSYSPHRNGFFMFPADVGGNNERMYVVTASAREIRSGREAETLARTLRAEAA